MDEDLRKTIYNSIFDFVYWDGCNNLLSKRMIREFKKTQHSWDAILRSSPSYFNESGGALQVRLLRLVTNLYNGPNINVRGNEITLEKVVFQLQELQKDFPEFSSQLSTMKLRVKIIAVIVCCRNKNFKLGLDVFKRQKLASYVESSDSVSSESHLNGNEVNSCDKSNIQTIEEILRCNDGQHLLLKEFNYASFLEDCLTDLNLIFTTIPKPKLINMFNGRTNNLNTENGLTVATRSHDENVHAVVDLDTRYVQVQRKRRKLTEENSEKLFEVYRYLLKRGSLSENMKEEVRTASPKNAGGKELTNRINQRLRDLGLLDKRLESSEIGEASCANRSKEVTTAVRRPRARSSRNNSFSSSTTESERDSTTRKRQKMRSGIPTTYNKRKLNDSSSSSSDANDENDEISSSPEPFPKPKKSLGSILYRLTPSALTPKRPLIKLISPRIKRRRKRNPWTDKEEEYLYFGVRTYGVGNWNMILSTSEYTFNDRKHIDLSDKWRNLQKPNNKWRLQELEKIYRAYLKSK